MTAEPWASESTGSPEVIVLEIRCHYRVGSRKLELPSAVTHAQSEQLTTAQVKGYKI